MSLDKQESRFWSHVDKSAEPGGCWIWTGALNAAGYGRVYWEKTRHNIAHRVAYQIALGAIPKGMFVLHRCDNPRCVNPDHLFLGTHQDNMKDMRAKGRSSNAGSKRGEANFASKLSREMVERIRFLYSSKFSVMEISRKTGVPYSNVWRIVHRKSWKHI